MMMMMMVMTMMMMMMMMVIIIVIFLILRFLGIKDGGYGLSRERVFLYQPGARAQLGMVWFHSR